MERLLVSGVDSLVGGNLALALADRCDVLGLYEHTRLESPAVRTARWQPDDPETIARHIETWQPHWIIHCGPLAASSWEQPEAAAQAEREPRTVARLADLAEAWGSRLAVISSDVVFAGPRMFHDENSAVTGTVPRAGHVRAMEQTLEHRDVLVARTHAYGWSFDAEEAGFAAGAFEALRTRAPLVADGRRHATPILATDLAELLWRAYETRLSGLYHLAGAERTSPRRFVLELADAAGIDAGCRLADAGPVEPWQQETSLSSKRARRMLACATPTLRDGLDRFVAQAKTGWRSSWHRGDRASETRVAAA